MASVWYIGPDSARVMSVADWNEAGVSVSAETRWDVYNGYSLDQSGFSTEQIAWLNAQPEEFWTGAADGPRQDIALVPDRYITYNQLRALFLDGEFGELAGLTKASVGLGNVDNTSDKAKPLSDAAVLALAGKANVGSGGSGGGTSSVTPVADSNLPSGTAYSISGSSVTSVNDPSMPSGVSYQIG